MEGQAPFFREQRECLIEAFIRLTCQLRGCCVSGCAVQAWQMTRTKMRCVQGQTHVHDWGRKQDHTGRLSSNELALPRMFFAKSLAKDGKAVALKQ